MCRGCHSTANWWLKVMADLLLWLDVGTGGVRVKVLWVGKGKILLIGALLLLLIEARLLW